MVSPRVFWGATCVIVLIAWSAAHAEILAPNHIPPEAVPGDIWGVAAFQSPGGQAHLLVAGERGIQTFNVADPSNPVRAGELATTPSRHTDVQTFRTPDGLPYGLVETDHATLVLNLADPTNPVVFGADIPGGPADLAHVLVVEWPDGRVHALGFDRHMGDSRIVDITDPHRPAPVSTAPVPYSWGHDCGGATFGSDHAYVVYGCRFSETLILNVTEPPHGLVVAGMHGGISPGDGARQNFSGAWTANQYYTAFRSAGEVTAFGLADGGSYAIVAGAAIRKVDGDLVPAGLLFLNVTDPGRPVPVGVAVNGQNGFDFGYVEGMVFLGIYGGSAYVAVAGYRQITVIDVTDPRNPVQAGAIRDGGSIDAVGALSGIDIFEAAGGVHLAAVGRDGIQLVRMADPPGFGAAGSVPNGPRDAAAPVAYSGFAVFEPGDGRTYGLGENGDGIQIIDVTDPLLPVTITSARELRESIALRDAFGTDAFTAPDGRTYGVVVGRGGLYVLDMTDPQNSSVASHVLGDGQLGLLPLSGMDTIRIRGNYHVLIGDHDRGVYVVDATNPRAPTLAGVFRPMGDMGGVHDVDALKDVAEKPHMMVTMDRGAYLVDLSRPGNPATSHVMNGSFGGYDVELFHQATVFETRRGDTWALLSDYASGVHLINVTNPNDPRHVGNVPVGTEDGVVVIPGSDNVVVVSPDDRVYALGTGHDHIWVADLTDPRNIVPAGRLDLGYGPWHITAWESGDGRLYALTGNDVRTTALDVTYPRSPVPVGSVVPGGYAGIAFGAGGGPAYMLADAGDVVAVMNLGDARAPRTMHAIPHGYGGAAISQCLGGVTCGIVAKPDGSVLAYDLADVAAGPLRYGGVTVAPDSALAAFRHDNGRTYVISGKGGIVNITDVAEPRTPAATIRDDQAGFHALDQVRDITVYSGDGGHRYLIAGSKDGVQLADITDPYNPVPAGVVHRLPGDAHGIIRAVSALRMPDGNMMALVVDGAGVTAILDVTDPKFPARLGTIPFHAGMGRVLDVAGFVASDRMPYVVLAGRNGSGIFSLSDPASPEIVVVLEGLAAANVDAFWDQNGRLHVALVWRDAIRIIDVDDPARFYAGDVSYGASGR